MRWVSRQLSAVRLGGALLGSAAGCGAGTPVMPCLHATPRCMIAQREYRVTVVVRN
jgi:hypothetical protein